jgi:hypothetical protein
MTAQVLFNQLTYIDRLTRGGFTPDQARASAEALEVAFSESVATKSDIAELKHEIASVKIDLEHNLTSLKTDLEHKLTAAETRLELKIAHTKNETLRWIFAFNLGLVGAIFTIIKYVH